MDGREKSCQAEESRRQRAAVSAWRATVALILFFVLAPCTVRAAVIAYPNSPVLPPGVQFTNVQESSGTDPGPLYGPPSYFTTGADFTPVGFVATATGGASDITDGQLNFTLNGNPGVAINSINLTEGGDYTLVGTGTPSTSVFAGAIIRVTVTAVDGVPVAPINVPTSSASVGFNLIANPGVVQPWGLGVNLSNINSYLTPGYTVGATRVDVSIDNSLIGISESGSVAFIAKKEFQVGVGTVVVPEPASAGLLLLFGAAGLAARRRRPVLDLL